MALLLFSHKLKYEMKDEIAFGKLNLLTHLHFVALISKFHIFKMSHFYKIF